MYFLQLGEPSHPSVACLQKTTHYDLVSGKHTFSWAASPYSETVVGHACHLERPGAVFLKRCEYVLVCVCVCLCRRAHSVSHV